MSKYSTATIIKILNNNYVLVKHDNKQKVFFGKGVGFIKSKGDKIEDFLIEKVFMEEYCNS